MGQIYSWMFASMFLLTYTRSNAELSKSSVSGGSLIGVSNWTIASGGKIEDTVESLLFGQVNASHYFSKYYDSANWYLKYVYILRQLGWILNDPVWIVGQNLRPGWKDVIESTMSSHLAQAEVEQLEDTITKFMKLPAITPAMQAFKESSMLGDISSFQVILIHNNGLTEEVVLGFYKLIILEQENDESTQSVGALYSVSKGYLNSTTYTNFRESVHLQLSKLSKMTFEI